MASLPMCGTTDNDRIGCSPGISAHVSEAAVLGFPTEKEASEADRDGDEAKVGTRIADPARTHDQESRS